MAGFKENPHLVEVRDLVVEFPLGNKTKMQAVAGVSFRVEKGETFGLVGESGCGKTSVARAVMQIPPPTSGRVWFQGEDLTAVSRHRLRALRPRFQIVFQDSLSALNPRRTVKDAVAMPLRIQKKTGGGQHNQAVADMLTRVGIDPGLFDRKPWELSGGQCQRVQIARALMTDPELLILDEPVSSLDVSVQAQIINLLERLRHQYGLTMLFISHDLAVVKNICDRVAVMYQGKLCEIARSTDLYTAPLHPYTAALLAAIPRPDPFNPPAKPPLVTEEITPSVTGCRFNPRCPQAADICTHTEPGLRQIVPGHQVACHFSDKRRPL